MANEGFPSEPDILQGFAGQDLVGARLGYLKPRFLSGNAHLAVNDYALLDSSAAGFWVSLPHVSTLKVGMTVVVRDVGGSCGTNLVTILRNGATIDGIAEHFDLDVDRAEIWLTWNGSTWTIGPSPIGGGSGGISPSLFNAHTILAATADDDPQPLTVGEATIVGRATGGNIAALTPSQGRTVLDVDQAGITHGAQKYYFSTAEFWLPTTNPCSVLNQPADPSSAGVGLRGYLFDASVFERILFDWKIPERMDVSQGLRYVVEWAPTNGNTGIVRWELRLASWDDGETITGFHQGISAFSDDAGSGVTNRFQNSPSILFDGSVLTSAVAGEHVQFALYRRADDSTNDTYNADARLIGVEIEWFSDAPTDD